MTTRNLSAPLISTNGFLMWRDAVRPQQMEIGEFLTIGRDSSNHVVVDDSFTSARHTRIERKAEGFLLRDLRSRNGTFLNGARIFEAQLNDGDRIRIGQTDMFFAFEQKTEAS